MKNLFVPYEIALSAKEKKFDDGCIARYVDKKLLPINHFAEPDFMHTKNSIIKSELNCSAPTYQQLIDWFREKHEIVLGVDYDSKNYFWFIKILNSQGIVKDSIVPGSFNLKYTYYEALEKSIVEALKLI